VRHTGNAKTKLAGSVVWPARWCFTLYIKTKVTSLVVLYIILEDISFISTVIFIRAKCISEIFVKSLVTLISLSNASRATLVRS
jgi:hypothetical protein